MRLVIAEKPSVAQSIAAVLGAKSRHDGYLEGGGYIVSWCFGHLAELADAAVYNADDAKWTLAALPIIPTSFRFIVRSEKQKQFDILRELMRREDAAEVVNACDAGREGELIFRTVYCLAGCSKPILRLWISSMEDDAIRSGFQQLKSGRDYDGLHQSALCRAKADWLVGMPERLRSVQEQLENLYNQQAAAKAEVGKPFPQEQELAAKTARLIELDMELNLDGKGQPQPEQAIAKSARPSVLDRLKASPVHGAPEKPHKKEMEAR